MPNLTLPVRRAVVVVRSYGSFQGDSRDDRRGPWSGPSQIDVCAIDQPQVSRDRNVMAQRPWVKPNAHVVGNAVICLPSPPAEPH